MRTVLAVVASLVAFLVAGSVRAQTPVFTDITQGAGIGMTPMLTESVAWGDYDNDDDEDLYLTNNGANVLFRNDGGGSFTDVTAQAGVGHPGFSVGTVFADLDNDGDLDLYIVSFSSGPDVLYRNNGPVGPGGAYTFTDVTVAAGITEERSSRGIGAIDFDRDGLLDLYVNAIGDDLLYRNLGNMQFEDVAASVGVTGVSGQGVGVVPTDIDNDGHVDLFTGNRSSDPNRLFRNINGSFADITVPAMITETGLGMGVLAFDFDNDLDFDLYYTTWPGTGTPSNNALYENLGNNVFNDIGAASGTQDPAGWGISCNAADIDNDGWEDFFVTNGFDPTSGPNVLFQNKGDDTFQDMTSALEFGASFDGRGAAFADMDGDGDMDLCVTADAGEPTRLWRNDTVTTNRWLILRLEGTCSNRSGVGARVVVTTAERSVVKEVSGGAGRGSYNSLPVEFGLGGSDVATSINIRWPVGTVQTLTDVASNQTLDVVEPLAADLDFDDDITIADLLAYLALYFGGDDGAERTGDTPPNITVADLLAFLAQWFTDGC